ncbi:MAG: radical SAM protein [Syntrophaceae bacterium]|nr:B12-binding domain-containing radical SAM protein [Deltaproteobacteria bacterium]
MTGRRILLVNPWIYDFAAYDLWAKPLGLLSLGAILRKNGCRVDFLDCLRSSRPLVGEAGPAPKAWGQGKFLRRVIDKPPQLRGVPRNYSRYGISVEAFTRDLEMLPRPDAVLVTSMMTYWYPGVFEAIRLIREQFPGVQVILGGVYATLCTEHARRFSGADRVITHEGERSVLALLAGIWGESFGYVPDESCLDALPYPCFDLIEDLRYVCIQTSRGCPYRCTYCASHYLCGHARRRDPAGVVEEILFWNREHKVEDFAFYDDALLAGPAAQTLLREIAQKVPGVRFHCPNGLHGREITRPVAGLMRDAGFATIRLGLETTDPSRQRETGGKVTSDEFARAMENLHRAGYDSNDIGAYILCGMPFQEAKEVSDAVSFVKEHGGRPLLSEYSPIPHTRDWEKAVGMSRYPLREEPLFHNNTLLPCSWEGFTLEMYREIRRAVRV